MDLSPSNETFSGNWRWWRDFETGIRYYEAALGTIPGATDVQDWINVGTDTFVFMSFFGERQLRHAQKYYLSVRATDNAGHQTVGSSDGVRIDLTPAQDGIIEHGLWDTRVSKYTNRDDLVLMRWRGIIDMEVRVVRVSRRTSLRGAHRVCVVCGRQSSITAYEYALASGPNGGEEGPHDPDMVPFVYIGLGDQAAVIDVELEHAHVYYGGVRALVRCPPPCRCAFVPSRGRGSPCN